MRTHSAEAYESFTKEILVKGKKALLPSNTLYFSSDASSGRVNKGLLTIIVNNKQTSFNLKENSYYSIWVHNILIAVMTSIVNRPRETTVKSVYDIRLKLNEAYVIKVSYVKVVSAVQG